jgi:hypothetical protein
LWCVCSFRASQAEHEAQTLRREHREKQEENELEI